MKLKSNEPFWLVKNGLKHSYPSLKEDIETDVLVIGSGITGSLIAHRCMEDGFKTVLVDRREVANGSTSATTSMLQYEIDIPLYKLIQQIGEKGAVRSYKACYDSIDQLEKIVKTVRSRCGFKRKSSLYFAAHRKDERWLMKEYDTRRKHGFPVQWMSTERIEKTYKITKTFGGILSSQGASIDAFCLAHDLLAYNHKRGLRIYDKTNIRSTQYFHDGVMVRTNKGFIIKAAKVIYCNGFESTEIIKDDFVKLLSTYAIVGESVKKRSPLDDVLVWNTAEPYIYMRTTDDNRLLIGGGDEEFSDAEKRDSLLEKKSARLTRTLDRIMPDHEFTEDFAWAGTFGETEDGLPYIGQHPEFLSSYFVLGFGGNGITFSVIGMDMVSAFLKGKKHPLTEYFRFRR